MARPIWSGAISFGLLQVPVQLMSAERRQDLSFRLLDARNKKPIRYERVNSETGEEVPWKEIVKAYEFRKGDYVIIKEEELDAAAAEATQTIDIESFIHAADVPPMYYEKPYYLVPVKKGEKGYVLLRDTLRDSGYAGMAKVVIRTRQHLALLLPVGDALVLNLIRFQQEVVEPEEYQFPSSSDKRVRINPNEIEMARQLIDSMVSEWNPAQFVDETRERLQKLIEQRIKGKKPLPRASEDVPVEGTNVVDFISVLRKSLETQRRTPAAASSSRSPKPAKPTVKTRKATVRKRAS
jgi:DNA end-binding protein Ku